MSPRALLLAAVAALAAGCAARPAAEELRRFEFEHAQMGTLFRIVAYAPDPVEAEAAARAAFERLDELDARLSDYDPDSELSRFARASDGPIPTRWIELSPDLWRVLRRAAEISEASGGAFDVTCGHATRLWRRAIREHELPEPDALERARAATDWLAVELDPQAPRARLLAPTMRLDLGAIAKGYALDEMLLVLARAGVRSALVDGGGDVLAGEPPPGERGWRVVVESGHGPAGERIAVHLAHAAIATSGDAFRSVTLGGRRHSHIVDPRTGIGLATQAGASVVAGDAMTADALATAATVVGPAGAPELFARFPGCPHRVSAAPEGSESVETLESASFRALREDRAPLRRRGGRGEDGRAPATLPRPEPSPPP